MYIAKYELDGVVVVEPYHQMPVDTLDEAKILVRARCEYLLTAIHVKIEHHRGMCFYIYTNSHIKGIVYIRKTV